jgi:hypothetical protein
MPKIYKSYIGNDNRSKVWDKCRETNLGHYLFHIGINYTKNLKSYIGNTD